MSYLFTSKIMKTLSGKKIKVVKTESLYKWAKNFKRIQERFYEEPIKLKRIKNIEDFITLNNYRKVYFIGEVELDLDINKDWFAEDITDCDLILITDQKFSRLPCDAIIEDRKSTRLNSSH